MAVYTPLNQDDMASIIACYGEGELVSFEPVGDGIENSNFFVEIQNDAGDKSHWVLTILEHLPQEELSFFVKLTRALKSKGFSVSAPIDTIAGDFCLGVRGKPAVLVPRLPGMSAKHPSVDQCERMGQWVANMHNAVSDYPDKRSQGRDVNWMLECADQLQSKMKDSDWQELNDYIERYKAYREQLEQCPSGLVHGDLFRDNVLFRMGHVSGVIDFYHACYDVLLFDLAVVANDWSIHINLGLIGSKHKLGSLEALIEGYQSVRPWTDQEKKMWPYCLELAALRFWVSRLMSLHFPSHESGSVEGDILKNPEEMKSILYGLSRPKERVFL